MAWLKREIGYQVQIRSRSAVMLSSEDAKKDCVKFYPCSRGKTTVVHFAVGVKSGFIARLPEGVPQQYGLKTGQYFFFPGQLYKHKNHALVIRALGLLDKNKQCVHVAFSGEKDSLRSQGYYEELRVLAKQKGVLSYVHFLGNIPFKDLMSLMYYAKAVMNPSLFEGWSTVVEEARSMGVATLLSDLPVHQEQMGNQARYFDRYSPASLAESMLSFSDMMFKGRDMEQSGSAIKEANERVHAFGENFYNFACSVKKEKS